MTFSNEWKEGKEAFKDVLRFYYEIPQIIARFIVRRYNRLKGYTKRQYQLFWFKHIIKGNEFHRSLDLDIEKLMETDLHTPEADEYFAELQRKRDLAHNLDMELNKLQVRKRGRKM